MFEYRLISVSEWSVVVFVLSIVSYIVQHGTMENLCSLETFLNVYECVFSIITFNFHMHKIFQECVISVKGICFFFPRKL